jgi:hypothetical protein
LPSFAHSSFRTFVLEDLATMGITISYRGRLADLTRIEDFEDRLLDLALEMGGQAQIWRSFADQDPRRVVRGAILNLAPGLESTSLLVAPEGWLIGLTDIKNAELGKVTEPPWCFTKTQFGPIEGHVALVEMLAALGREFLTYLEVSDEGGYWVTRDLAELARRRTFLQGAIEGIAEGLERHGLSGEAAEDPEILLRRIERIAGQVSRILARPAEHPPVEFPEDETFGVAPDLDAAEKQWDEMIKHKRRQQEWMLRSIEERRSRGESDEGAFDHALNDLGLEMPGEETEADDEPWREDERESFLESLDEESTPAEVGDEKGDPFADEDERHPLMESALDLLMRLHTVFKGADPQYESALSTLYQGSGDAMGGLAQALAGREYDMEEYGLCVVQLKRALRGAAFARGAMFLLRPALPAEAWQELQDKIRELERGIFQELNRVREEYGAGEG